MTTCPYKDNSSLKKLPCNWHSHPENSNIRLCDCGNFYKIDELVEPFQGSQSFFVVLTIVILILGQAVRFEKPGLNAPVPQNYNQLKEIR
ncbi:MAG: hypothetical protein JGK30_20465 [Microcoleus sp. PH2017_40_RAT_O_B]|uniref:hypothetical protein n=1 Tax=unclassified Microcoleus TaxID=2642155 RepID=UPI001D8DF8A1|nr:MULTISPECIES: hypothetical protein [unclassified Microcoleus]MCC3574259.1 hypothetical protein [Microcoleus sp. PH2017_34_RAT_O_A]MCC3611783.1 hypothetical protein [Microcoleus sp. PH2017_40_RAT_O_B]